MKRLRAAIRLGLGLCVLYGVTAAAQEEPITILVKKSTLVETGWLRGEPAGSLNIPVDGGDFLRGFTGVSGARMGGRALDPVIRGQSQTRLNVLLDGAYVHGGCPNRMDPPAGYAPPETYDKVTVIRGSQTVRYGAGGSGGTVLFERDTPPFDGQQSYRGRASAGYTGNAGTTETALDLAAGGARGYVRGIGQYADAGDYEDGDGRTVRSGYRTHTGNLLLGYTPDAHTRLELSGEALRESDVLYAGSGMDAPYSHNDILRLKFARAAKLGPFNGMDAELYYSAVEHLMDNYSLRPLAAGSMKMRAPTTSDTRGGRLALDWAGGGGRTWQFGLDYQGNQRDAARYAGPANQAEPGMLQAVLWPDVEIEQAGVFAEGLLPLGEDDTLRLGLRYDRATASAGKARQAAGGVMPADLYRKYYGVDAAEHTENNVSGVVRYERPLSEATRVFASLSRSVRGADATERFFAGNSPAANQRWIGNPGLAAERHQQVELGFSRGGADWDTLASVFYDRVGDYILRDRAHGQAGILESDSATIYRNVDARLYGVEWESGLRWGGNWASRLGLAYTRAHNRSDDRPIAQTPPLEGSLGLNYYHARGLLGATLRFAARQDRVDGDAMTGSGLDARQTPGFAALDLSATLRQNRYLEWRLGVNNVFDRAYAYHVNRANADPFNPGAVQVNEPGRSLWLKAVAQF